MRGFRNLGRRNTFCGVRARPSKLGGGTRESYEKRKERWGSLVLKKESRGEEELAGGTEIRQTRRGLRDRRRIVQRGPRSGAQKRRQRRDEQAGAAHGQGGGRETVVFDQWIGLRTMWWGSSCKKLLERKAGLFQTVGRPRQVEKRD